MRARVQLLIAGEWVTLTFAEHGVEKGRLLVDAGVSPSTGRRDEQSSVAPGQATMRLRNPDGWMTPGNQASPYWPYNDLDTHARVQVRPSEGAAWVTRFAGEITRLDPVWPAMSVTGLAEIELEISGGLRRWQGSDPLRSSLYRRITSFVSDPRLLAYWNMEDIDDRGRALSPLPGVTPMLVAMRPRADSSLPSSSPLPSGNAPWGFNGAVPGANAAITYHPWRVEWVLRVPEPPETGTARLMRVSLRDAFSLGTPISYVELVQSATQLTLRLHDPDGGSIASASAPVATFFDDWCFMRVAATPTIGGDANFFLSVWQGGDTEIAVAISGGHDNTGRPDRVLNLSQAQLPDSVTMGHLLVQAGPTTENILDGPSFIGHAGETAADRFTRLCAEEGITSQVIGTADDSPAMGPQRPLRIAELLDETAQVGGIVTEALDEPAQLAFRTRESLHNQTPVPVNQSVSNPYAPSKDNQRWRNRVTASQPDGGSATYTDDDHIKRHLPHDWSVSVNTADGRDLPHHAAWWVWLGTPEDPRLPRLAINLSRLPEALRNNILGLRIGDRLHVPASALAESVIPADVLVEGSAESISDLWVLTLNCSPAKPWDTGIFDSRSSPGQGHGRFDARTTQLETGVDEQATSLDVISLTGLPWVNSTDHPEEFPLDVETPTSGERMTVTAITQPVTVDGHEVTHASDTFDDRALATGWGDATDGQTWVLYDASGSPDRSVSGGGGHITHTTSVDGAVQTLGESVRDLEILMSVSADTLPGAGEGIDIAAMMRLDLGLFAEYAAVIEIDDTAAVDLVLFAEGPGGSELVALVSTGITYTADQILWLRARVDEGHRIRARVWEDGDPEPGTWTADGEVTDTAIHRTGGAVGVLSSTNNAGTVVSVWLFDAVELTTVATQTMTVTRAQDGTVARPLTAGASVRVAEPLRWASPKGVT